MHARNLTLIYSDNDLGEQVENSLLLPEGSHSGEEGEQKPTFSSLNKEENYILFLFFPFLFPSLTMLDAEPGLAETLT